MMKQKMAMKRMAAIVLFGGALALSFSRVMIGNEYAIPAPYLQNPAPSQSVSAPGPQESTSLVFHSGTVLLVRLVQPVTSRSSDTIDAELTTQLSQNQHIAFPRGTRVRGHVIITKNQNRPGFASLLLDAIQAIDGKWMDIKTTPVMSRLKGLNKKEPGASPPPASGDGSAGASNSFAEKEGIMLYPSGKKLAFALTDDLMIQR